jgi:hypothetical protein
VTAPVDRSVELAEQHSAGMGPRARETFMVAFCRARTDVVEGLDTEARWLRMQAEHAAASSLAGYVEGLASLRRQGRCR